MIRPFGIQALGSPSKRDALFFEQLITFQPDVDATATALHEYLIENGVLVQAKLHTFSHKMALEPVVDIDEHWAKLTKVTDSELDEMLLRGYSVSDLRNLFWRIPNVSISSDNDRTLSGTRLSIPMFPDANKSLAVWVAKVVRITASGKPLSTHDVVVLDSMTRFLSHAFDVCKIDNVTGILQNESTEGQISHDNNEINLYELIIGKFPVPDEFTPWEQIVEFRKDPDIQARRIEFRRWLRSVITATKSPHEIEDEIQYLINSYTAHMRLHRLKYKTSLIKTITSLPIEIAESIVKVTWSKIPKSILSIVDSKLALTEAELKAPGREVSYIVRASESFRC